MVPEVFMSQVGEKLETLSVLSSMMPGAQETLRRCHPLQGSSSEGVPHEE